MKIIFVVMTLLASIASAQTPGAGRWGLGLMVGSPTAIAGKYWVSQTTAVDMGLGFGPGNWTMVFADFHWNFPGIFGSSSKFLSQLTGYVGLGGGLSAWSRTYYCNRWVCDSTRDSGTAIFVRSPFGVEWHPGHPPLGVFVELAPLISLTPLTGGSIDLGVGARYYF